MTENVNLRAVVLDILSEILDNEKYSHIVLNQALLKYQYLEKSERAFITRLVMGTLENRIYLEYVTNHFSKTKTMKMKPVIRNIILMSVYQILYMENVPDSAAVNEAVKLVNKRGLSGLKGFVNGVLRSVARDGKNLVIEEKDPIKVLSIRYSVPEWIVREWNNSYGIKKTETILKALLLEKKTYIRCVQGNVSNMQENLQKRGIKAKKNAYVEYAFEIEDYNYLGTLEEFQEGKIAVQDISSMLAGVVAAPQKGNLVLDVCAAPGGKATHAAQLMEETGLVIARDLSASKTELIVQNVERLGLKNVRVEAFDATVYDSSLEGKVDVLICDLPCSGLGIMGRKPDIKYRMSKMSQQELVELQRKILSTVYRYVKVGGRMIYSTCTINRDENEENTKWILENLPFEEEDIAEKLPMPLREDRSSKGSIQLLPGVHESDGFYISAFIRK